MPEGIETFINDMLREQKKDTDNIAFHVACLLEDLIERAKGDPVEVKKAVAHNSLAATWLHLQRTIEGSE